jgi:hypothetical protein
MAAALAQAMRAERAFSGGRELFEQLVAYLESREAQWMKHSELERELENRGRELLRALYQGYLDRRAPGEAAEAVRDVEGVEQTHEREQSRGLETVFGTVRVDRMGYGSRGSASLHPLDGELNLPSELYSHELRRRAAEEAAKGSFDETVETLSRYTGARIAKRQVEELVLRAAQDFDAFYERRKTCEEADPGGSSVLVLTSDGKGVVMRRQDLRESTRKAADRRKHKLRTRHSKGEKRDAKRMATVASVYTIAPYVRTPEQVARSLAPVHEIEGQRRPRPENKRVWASLEKDPEEVLEEAFREAAHRDPRREKTWVAVVDGNETQLRILKKLSSKYKVELRIVLDFIHVTEYLWKAGLALYQESDAALEAWVSERLLQVLRGRASHVAAGMRRSATLRQLAAEERNPVDTCADYLLKYKSYLAYDEYLAAGLPIASGVIEGACRHLVKDRMDLTGACWSLAGAEAVLRLRALRSSKDFDEYWSLHESLEQERNHKALYADGRIPRTKQPGLSGDQPRLRLVE